MGAYDDIIHLPHHRSTRRPHMPILDRAAQFSPFAALTGYDAVIDETARITDCRVHLDDSAKNLLDRQLQHLSGIARKHPAISVTVFIPDALKAGGTYTILTGQLKKIDEYLQLLIMEDGTQIPFMDIYLMESDDLPHL